MSLTINSNKVFLPGVGEHGSFIYAICKVIICRFFLYNVTYVMLMSRNKSHICLQLMFKTRSKIESLNNFIDTFVNILLVLYSVYFNFKY